MSGWELSLQTVNFMPLQTTLFLSPRHYMTIS